MTKEELERAHQEAEDAGTACRALAVINPGNPVGAVLGRADIEMMLDFATENDLVVLADEVYQENIYAEGKSFVSFKKVLMEMRARDAETYAETQLISFHSTSKGLIGECGQRGGYMEFVGFSERTLAQFTKVAATSLSSNTIGQVFCGLMVTPPKTDGPSYPLFRKEVDGIFDGLKRRAKALTEGLNHIPGLRSNPIEGAMYAFPSLELPAKAVEKARSQNLAPDAFWCMQLVEKTGIVCVPGSGFGQKDGTYHFRITILPPDDMLQRMIERLRRFQEDFLKEYGGSASAGG